jgi:D-alanyl-D-alanine carboxypeptidase
MMLSLVLLAVAVAPPKIACPASPMGKLGCEAVVQLNRSPAELKRWLAASLAAHVPADDRQELEKTLLEVATTGGGVELVGARAGHTPGVAVLTLQARRKPAQLLLVLRPDPSEPSKLGRLEVAPLQNPALFADWPTTHLPDDALAARVQAQLRRLAAEQDFSGCVSVSSGKQTLVEACTGLAERTFAVPVTPETRFHIGSMDKMFTALAIAQLVEAHKLTYDDTLSRWIPEVAGPSTPPITVWQLLHHQGGLGDLFVPEFFEHRERYVHPADYLALIARQPTVAAPGERFGYSNAGFVLLGRIVELASGEDYFAYLQRHVFGPAGMTATGFDAVDEVTPQLAVGYLHDDPFGLGPWKANWMTLPFKGSPAGGGYATTGDLIRFSQALRAGKLLPAQALAKVFADAVPTGPDQRYAAGFEERLIAGQTIRGHSGGAPGMNAALEIDWASGSAVAVVSNEDGPAGELLAHHIADLLAAPKP